MVGIIITIIAVILLIAAMVCIGLFTYDDNISDEEYLSDEIKFDITEVTEIKEPHFQEDYDGYLSNLTNQS